MLYSACKNNVLQHASKLGVKPDKKVREPRCILTLIRDKFPLAGLPAVIERILPLKILILPPSPFPLLMQLEISDPDDISHDSLHAEVCITF